MKAEKSTKEDFFEYLFYLFIFLLFLLLSFKVVRTRFLPPEIGTEKIIGYSQYFGYPLYFDNIFFLYLVCSPFFAFVALLLRKKIWRKFLKW